MARDKGVGSPGDSSDQVDVSYHLTSPRPKGVGLGQVGPCLQTLPGWRPRVPVLCLPVGGPLATRTVGCEALPLWRLALKAAQMAERVA